RRNLRSSGQSGIAARSARAGRAGCAGRSAGPGRDGDLDARGVDIGVGSSAGSHAALDLAFDQQSDVGGAFLVAVAAEAHHVAKVIQAQMLRAAVIGTVEERTMISRP